MNPETLFTDKKTLKKMAFSTSQKDIFDDLPFEDQNKLFLEPPGVVFDVSIGENREFVPSTSTTEDEASEANIESSNIEFESAPILDENNRDIIVIPVGTFRASFAKALSNNEPGRIYNITINVPKDVSTVVIANSVTVVLNCDESHEQRSKILDELKPNIQIKPGIPSNLARVGDGRQSSVRAKDESANRSEFCLGSVSVDSKH